MKDFMGSHSASEEFNYVPILKDNLKTKSRAVKSIHLFIHYGSQIHEKFEKTVFLKGAIVCALHLSESWQKTIQQIRVFSEVSFTYD